MTWAWFRPTKDAWADGAHWFRCDVVGGGEQSKSFVALPDDRQGPAARQARRPLAGLRRRPERQRLGEDPVHREHTWRAVTTIVLGKDTDDYPGDRLVEVRTRDFCSRLGGRLAELPGRLRLRLHVVPRGGVEGRQPPLDLLGQDRPVSAARRCSSCRWRRCPAARRVHAAAPRRAAVAVPLVEYGVRRLAPRTPRRPPRPSYPRRRRTGPATGSRPRSSPSRPTRRRRCPCASRHTAQTIYVGMLDTVVDGHAVAVDSATVQRQLSHARARASSRRTSAGRRTARDLSRFNVVWYSPTLEPVRRRRRLVPLRPHRVRRPGPARAAARRPTAARGARTVRGAGRPTGCAARRRPAPAASSG